MTDTIDPNRGTIGGTVREHIRRLEAALAAEKERAVEWDRLARHNERLIQDATNLAETERAARVKAEAALRAVEEWWLAEGMKHFNGAPYAIFAVRAALGETP